MRPCQEAANYADEQFYGSEPTSASSLSRNLAAAMIEEFSPGNIGFVSGCTASSAADDTADDTGDHDDLCKTKAKPCEHNSVLRERSSNGPVPKHTCCYMVFCSAIFFTLGFVPLMSTQHHSEKVLMSTSQQHPTML